MKRFGLLLLALLSACTSALRPPATAGPKLMAATNNQVVTQSLAVYDHAGAIVPVASDQLGIQNIGGSLVQVNPNGTTSSIGGGGGAASWLATQLTRAQLISPLLVNPYHENFLIQPGNNVAGQQIAFASILVGSGTATKQSVPGGVYCIDTTAAANSSAMLTTPNNNGDFVMYNPAAGPFYLSFREKAQGSAFAGEVKFCGALTNTFANFVVIAIVNGQLSVRITKQGAGASVLTASSYVVDYANAHDYAVGFDGTTVQGYVDGVAIPGTSTTTLTNLPTANLWVGCYVENGSTAQSSKLCLDDMAYVFPELQ